ncbi:stage III sporulation protein AE [Lentibacillus populi]|uniref:Stage III sporulation protein AE n=1 Tax=Lentibacillus populi TaxID=1827502 RepID=A0A9W5X7P0_9BACI|nr:MULTISPECIES: stage III sporulation protein AE [Bacillaceae]MBT2214422.1 stage III sporulation protein AE [Virgibacillus dakarensis]GGB62075.1 stage III sporulation protein AE [Lentibacillus populi]
MKLANRSIVVLVILLILTSFSGRSVFAAATDTNGLEANILEEIELDGIQQYWDKLVSDYSGYIPELEKTSLYEFIKDNGSFSMKNILSGIVKYLFYEIILNGKLLGLLLMLTLFSVLLQMVQTAFERNTVSKIAYFIVYLVLLYLALNSFYLAFSYTKDAIDSMSDFLIALLPLVLGLMATFGNVVSVSFFHPIIVFLIYVSGVLVSKFILPLIFLSALLMIVSSLNDRYKVTHLANLFKSVALGVLGVFLTIFLGVMSVQGAASAIQDGVAMKTAKFITGNFIPIVGRTFTDAADTILSASLLLKNAVGIVGLVIVVFLALFPAIKIFAIAFIYKIAAAVLQPIADGPVITSLNVISKHIFYILAALLAVTLMFFLAIVILVVASNITLLLR